MQLLTVLYCSFLNFAGVFFIVGECACGLDIIVRLVSFTFFHGWIQRGERGSGPPEQSQNIGFLSKTGPDPLKNHKATKPDLVLGHQRHASETPF